MLRILSLALVVTLLVITGCKTSYYKDPTAYSGPKIGFGNNKTKNGQDATYILLKNGQIFVRTVDDTGKAEMSGLGRIDASEAEDIFNEAERNNIATMTFNRPAKQFYYIMYYGKGQKNRVVWSDKEPAPKELLDLYDRLYATLPKIK